MLKMANYDEFNSNGEAETTIKDVEIQPADDVPVEPPAAEPLPPRFNILNADHICELMGIGFPFKGQAPRKISEDYVPVKDR